MRESASALLERDPLRLAPGETPSRAEERENPAEVCSGNGMPECQQTMKTSVRFPSRERPSGEDSEDYVITRYALDPVRDSARVLP